MTKDDIIYMAKQAGMEVWKSGHRYMDNFDIYKFAALVAAHERKECAKLAEELWEDDATAFDCAVAIRKRGKA